MRFIGSGKIKHANKSLLVAFLHGLHHSSSDKSVEKLPILLHPLFQTFMSLKWKTVRKYGVLEVITHILLVVFITITGVQYAVQNDCNYIKEPNDNDCHIRYDYRQNRYKNETPHSDTCIRKNELCFKNDYYNMKFKNGSMLRSFRKDKNGSMLPVR